MVLDPKRLWSIHRSGLHIEFQDGDVANWEDNFEYRGDTDAIPQQETFIFNVDGKNRGGKSTVEFVKYQRRQAPVSELSLAAYGLELPADSAMDRNGFIKIYYGKEPPPLAITDARGVRKDVKLADYHGKWVLLDFWGPNCAPCIQRMPALAKFYEDHRAQRNQFEIIGVCVVTDENGPKTMEQLDAVMAPTIEKAWGGKPLPFPTVIDGEGKTFEAYDILSVPCQVLIDPEGHVVKNGDETMLAEKLKQK